MKYIKNWIPFWLLFVMAAAGAQITNIGEVIITNGTLVTASDNFTNAASGTVHNNGELYLYGDLYNNGTLSFGQAGARRILFQGTGSQEIAGNRTIEIYNTTFDNDASGAPFSLGNTLNITNSVDFIQGVINTRGLGGEFIFTPSSNHAGASDFSHVDGSVNKIGGEAFTFPVGNGGFSNQNTITASNIADAEFISSYELKNSNDAYPHNAVRGLIGFVDDMEYWTVEKTRGNGFIALTLPKNNNTMPMELVSAEPSQIHVIRWNDTSGLWEDKGGIVNNDNSVSSVLLVDYGIFTLALTSTDATDSDGDGVPDFMENNTLPPTDPNDPLSFTDTDGDGVPDFAENNGDVSSDPNNPDDFPDADNDGIADYIEDQRIDTDGDGLPDFLDPDNTNTDTDGDGIPDGADVDVDGDGFDDNGTDTDGDGINDEADVDVNGDGIADNGTDTDGDGIRDDNDTIDDILDTDNDGVPDVDDAFPNDPDESIDMDGDGIGANNDIDDNDATLGKQKYIVAAQAFTPNGDGINDTWVIEDIENHPNAIVSVFNRYGHEVFKTIGYQNDWNGRTSSRSENLPAGSYYFVIDLQNDTAPVDGWLFLNY